MTEHNECNRQIEQLVENLKTGNYEFIDIAEMFKNPCWNNVESLIEISNNYVIF